jgi:hypothetical protein
MLKLRFCDESHLSHPAVSLCVCGRGVEQAAWERQLQLALIPLLLLTTILKDDKLCVWEEEANACLKRHI